MDWPWGLSIGILIVGTGALWLGWRYYALNVREGRRDRREERRDERRDDRLRPGGPR